MDSHQNPNLYFTRRPRMRVHGGPMPHAKRLSKSSPRIEQAPAVADFAAAD